MSLPNSLKFIGNGIFSNCNALNEVLCYAEEIPEVSTNTFNYFPKESVTLYVPTAALEDYKATEPWSGFGKILPLTDEQIQLSVESVKGAGKRIDKSSPAFNLRGQQVDKDTRGLVIIGGKKVIR